MTAPQPNIFYLVHDLSDAAVARRIQILKAGGATVTVAGFKRKAESIASIAECPAIDLGQTYNGNFIQRVVSVLREVVRTKNHHKHFENADIIIARNLEMLAIAVRGRSLCKKKPVLVYECLDIHRLLLNTGIVGKIMRQLEGWLCKSASALITSSPAFIKSYFDALSEVSLPVILAENKVYDPTFLTTPDLDQPRVAGPPWRIGWYGIIRCHKSFSILSELVRRNTGAVEVIIRGRPALDQIPDFYEVVKATPGLTYAGPYKNPDDLRSIYRDVHFTWAIDMFEEGLNSSWLLPNRLYEGGLYNTVPLARASVETGHFLIQHGIGGTLEEPLDTSLNKFFKNIDDFSYQKLENNAMEIPRAQWLFTQDECVDFVSTLSALKTIAN